MCKTLDRTPAEILATARASWEPLGLPEPGMVHLSGPAVHHHRCTSACFAYPPGWYPVGQAIGILRTLPDESGEYGKAIAELTRSPAVAP